VGNRLPNTEGNLESYFAGEFAHSLDEKGRLAIPAKFRGRFKEGAVVTRWIGECLAVFPAPEWDDLNAEITKRPRTDPAVARFRHFVLAGAHAADKKDNIYVSDSQSDAKTNPGFGQGIRIGTVKDKKVAALMNGAGWTFKSVKVMGTK